MRKFDSRELVLASHNAGKLAELRALLSPLGVSVTPAATAGLKAPDETEATFEGNAALKARAACEATGLPALADDSGLEVAALGGRPGVHSSRWATADGDHGPAMRRVLDGLKDQTDRSARFVCVLALAWPDGHVETVRGEAPGRIAEAPSGEGGFGYDPIFVPRGEQRTFAQMDAAEKRAISHRAHAMRQLTEGVFAA